MAQSLENRNRLVDDIFPTYLLHTCPVSIKDIGVCCRSVKLHETKNLLAIWFS